MDDENSVLLEDDDIESIFEEKEIETPFDKYKDIPLYKNKKSESDLKYKNLTWLELTNLTPELSPLTEFNIMHNEEVEVNIEAADHVISRATVTMEAKTKKSITKEEIRKYIKCGLLKPEWKEISRKKAQIPPLTILNKTVPCTSVKIDHNQLVLIHKNDDETSNIFVSSKDHKIPIIQYEGDKTNLYLSFKTLEGNLLEKAIIVNSILEKQQIGIWSFIPLNTGTRKKVIEYKLINGNIRVINYEDYQVEESVVIIDDIVSYDNYRDDTEDFTTDDAIKCYNMIPKLKKPSRSWATVYDALLYINTMLYSTNDPTLIMKLLTLNTIIGNNEYRKEREHGD